MNGEREFPILFDLEGRAHTPFPLYTSSTSRTDTQASGSSAGTATAQATQAQTSGQDSLKWLIIGLVVWAAIK